MRLLVDTHALLWWLTDDPRLSYAAEAAISDPDNEVFVSACIGYEIAYKQRLGRLPPLPESLSRRLERQVSRPVRVRDVVAQQDGDPFDDFVAMALAAGE